MPKFRRMMGIPGSLLIFLFDHEYSDGTRVNVAVSISANGFVKTVITDSDNNVLYETRGLKTATSRETFEKYMPILMKHGKSVDDKLDPLLVVEDVVVPKNARWLARYAVREAKERIKQARVGR